MGYALPGYPATRSSVRWTATSQARTGSTISAIPFFTQPKIPFSPDRLCRKFVQSFVRCATDPRHDHDVAWHHPIMDDTGEGAAHANDGNETQRYQQLRGNRSGALGGDKFLKRFGKEKRYDQGPADQGGHSHDSRACFIARISIGETYAIGCRGKGECYDTGDAVEMFVWRECRNLH